jgi:peptide/nickel transport system substrate-binding protein
MQVGIALALALAAPCAAATFRWASDGDLHTLDPYAQRERFQQSFLANIYEPLVRRGATLAPEPALATSWSQVAPRVWRFDLRRDVRFQDGTPFTADDVVFSFARVQEATSHLAASVAAIKEVRKIDAATVDLVTAEPDALLPLEIADWDIMSAAWCQANDATAPADLAHDGQNFASDHADGTGPFKLEAREPGARTVLVRNRDWWDSAQETVDEAIFEPIADAEQRVAALAAGDLDMIYAVPPDAIDHIGHTPGLRIVHGPSLRTVFLGFNQFPAALPEGNVKGRNPFRDRRVRLAVASAIDESAIVAKVMRGMARPAGLLVGPGVDGYDPRLDTRPAFDPAAARRLLADAGYPQGFATGLTCPTDRYVNDEAICQEVAAMLAKVGIKVALTAVPRADYFARLIKATKPAVSLYLFGWDADTYDTLDVLTNLAATRLPGTSVGAFNIGGYSNPALDGLLARAASEGDGAKRAAFLGDALKIARDDVAYVPLHQQEIVWAAREGVDLVQPADGTFSLRYVKLNE